MKLLVFLVLGHFCDFFFFASELFRGQSLKNQSITSRGGVGPRFDVGFKILAPGLGKEPNGESEAEGNRGGVPAMFPGDGLGGAARNPTTRSAPPQASQRRRAAAPLQDAGLPDSCRIALPSQLDWDCLNSCKALGNFWKMPSLGCVGGAGY